MVQGTTSDAGKSMLVTGLGRVLARRNTKVAPFKAQNMALNSAVTPEGGEIGRAQAFQALACGVAPHVDMNPVLLKPNSDTGAQVIVQGAVYKNMDAKVYHNHKPEILSKVLQSFTRLTTRFDTILVEGAGSPAEINLRDRDIVNMGFAEAADVPVIIIADIDKGGVFAHLYGTLALLSQSEQDRVLGFVINRFRGDISLLQSGLDWLEQKTQKKVFGVIPYLHGLKLDAEDAIEDQQERVGKFKVVVLLLQRTSNHTDFDALRFNPDLDFCYARFGQTFPKADLIIIPGSKSVRADLQFIRDNGWDKQIERHLRYGGKVIGICGGYQILGQSISDPLGIEGESGCSQGLSYLPCHTQLKSEKSLKNRTATLSLPNQETVAVEGYEIHAGSTTISEAYEPVLSFENGETDGVISPDNQIMGCYLHGLFDSPQASSVILEWAGATSGARVDLALIREQNINRLADCLEQHMDFDALGWESVHSD
ncbi:cobyric acid synthase [Alginatibacterium sediminis]|uniref:Cobyric acid synthase n=1 Tax=Alginatibacterium sediminis TaxID=2164068 RepID=A0A420EIT4_9ALTE|nr:cobyric acid synthase [Alginatibacterium sediminis]RKF20476.1 cobyric acid synthase [Alginatibacterium sediminis]